MTRQEALQTELDFWQRFLGTGEYAKYPDWADIHNLDAPFPESWAQWLPAKERPFVLDVGSGPVCRLGNLLPDGRRTSIFCVDPLADEYAKIRERVGFSSRAPVMRMSGIEFCANYGPADLVVASNSLDHSENPLAVLADMCDACLSEGHVIVCGYINEANEANGYGLHRWNMRIVDGRALVIEPYGDPVSRKVLHEFDGRKVVSAQEWPDKRWFEVVFGPKEGL